MLKIKISYRLTRDSRDFVKNVNKAISRKTPVTPDIIEQVKLLEPSAKFSKNPIKNLIYFFQTFRQVQREINHHIATSSDAGRSLLKIG